MIMSIEELRQYVTTSETDAMLEAKLQAIEILIRKHTNNNFQARNYRSVAAILDDEFIVGTVPMFKVGDTVQVSASKYNNGLYTVKAVDESSFTVNEDTVDDAEVLCTKVVYPMDVKMGVVNMMKWDLENRSKVGVQSETVSRHSVTYFNMDGDNSSLGYPKSLTGFLKPYMKARF